MSPRQGVSGKDVIRDVAEELFSVIEYGKIRRRSKISPSQLLVWRLFSLGFVDGKPCSVEESHEALQLKLRHQQTLKLANAFEVA